MSTKPTPKSEAGQDPKANRPQPDGETAAELSRGPAGSQLNQDGGVDLPAGSTRDTKREGQSVFKNRPVRLPGDQGDGDGNDQDGPFDPNTTAARDAGRARGPRLGRGEDGEPTWPAGQTAAAGDKQAYMDAIECIAAAVKKLTEAGLGGAAAADLAAKVYCDMKRGR